MNPTHMPNLNRPTIRDAGKLTEDELNRAIAEKPWPQRRVEPLPPMDFQPEAAHCASEIDDDDYREPMTRADRIERALLFWGAIVFVGFMGWLAVTL